MLSPLYTHVATLLSLGFQSWAFPMWMKFTLFLNKIKYLSEYLGRLILQLKKTIKLFPWKNKNNNKKETISKHHSLILRILQSFYWSQNQLCTLHMMRLQPSSCPAHPTWPHPSSAACTFTEVTLVGIKRSCSYKHCSLVWHSFSLKQSPRLLTTPFKASTIVSGSPCLILEF